MKIASVLALVSVLSLAPAHAAVTTIRVLACKTPEDSKKADDLQTKGDKIGLDKFGTMKVQTGDCIEVPKGVTVTIDEKKPPLMCLRLTGGLDCYWAAASVVDARAPEPEAKGGIQRDLRELRF